VRDSELQSIVRRYGSGMNIRALAAILGVLIPVGLLPGQDYVVVVSAANFGPGLPARGSLTSIFCFCSSLVGIDRLVVAETMPLPLKLAGVEVSIGGSPAPLLAVAPGNGYYQINAQVPLQPKSTIGVEAIIKIAQGPVVFSHVVPLGKGPGEFFRFTGSEGAFQKASDFSPISEQNPALPGEAVIGYMTGLQTAVPNVPDGVVSPSFPLSTVPLLSPANGADSYSIIIQTGNVVYRVAPLFVGLSPGLVGIFQVNFVMPLSSPGTKIESAMITLRYSR